MDFAASSIGDIDGASPEALDTLPFGVIGFDTAGTVDLYSATESRMAGLSPDKVIGKHLFAVVAPCMNNYMVAQRFEDEPELDATIDYVLTLRMRPTPVKLRLLQSAGAKRRYLLVQR
ncbi:MAG: Photoactive yellow protein [Enterovirga sp.]|jgi:photoactive yellow protein|nr:Photoactive yellow protein [Enterovirga sp.]